MVMRVGVWRLRMLYFGSWRPGATAFWFGANWALHATHSWSPQLQTPGVAASWWEQSGDAGGSTSAPHFWLGLKRDRLIFFCSSVGRADTELHLLLLAGVGFS